MVTTKCFYSLIRKLTLCAIECADQLNLFSLDDFSRGSKLAIFAFLYFVSLPHFVSSTFSVKFYTSCKHLNEENKDLLSFFYHNGQHTFYSPRQSANQVRQRTEEWAS